MVVFVMVLTVETEQIMQNDKLDYKIKTVDQKRKMIDKDDRL